MRVCLTAVSALALCAAWTAGAEPNATRSTAWSPREDEGRIYRVASHSKAATSTDSDDRITVGKGDTLASIAKAHDVAIEDLAKANGLKSPYRLIAGQSLKLPAASEPASQDSAPAPKATVAKGDTLASIARKSGLKIEDLARINHLEAPYRLKIGQTLALDDKAPAASDAPSTAHVKAKAAPADIGDLAAEPATSTITVRRKDTIQSLARQAHVPVAELARLNHLKKPYRLKPGQKIQLPDQPGAAPSRPPAAREPDSALPTIVKAGRSDTLKSIAQAHGVSVQALAKLNRLKPPYRLKRGQAILVPGRKVEAAATSYEVQGGDTLYSLARRFGTDPKTLAEANGMAVGDPLKVGRRIRLPGGAEDRAVLPPAQSQAATPSAPVPYTPFGATPPSSSPPVAPEAQPAPYRPSAPPAEAATAGDAEVAAAGKGLFTWPARGDILQRFGPGVGGQRNDGVDIAGGAGDSVAAAAAGEVVYAGDSVPGFGNLVLIRHDGGWVTAYAHLKNLEVKMRQTVIQGQEIGQVGQTGGVSQPQLHFEVRYAPTAKDKARPIDPLLVLPQ